ncbi:hypothetical protein L0Y46_02325, partial [bacterium]|nr:hypothetical protein [bacterium]
MHKKNPAYLILAAFILISMASMLGFSFLTADAAINQQINYQGKLTDSSGAVVSNGNYNLRFNLYTAVSGGSSLWTETWSGADRVTVTDGLFSVLLGSTTAFTGVDFNQTLYLGVEVGGTGGTPSWDGEMTPRKRIGAAPAALEADKIDGLSSEQFLRSDASNATTSSGTFLTLTQSGTGDIINLFDGVTEVFTIVDGGNIGIGTTSPYAALSVVGETVSSYFTATSGTATTTLAGGLTVDTSDFVVDPDAGRVGIGTTSPYAALSVVGEIVGAYFTGTTTATSTLG